MINHEPNLAVTDFDGHSAELTAIIRGAEADLVLVADEDDVLDRIERVLSASPTARIVAFSSQWDNASVITALRLGVRGLGVTSGSRSAILAAIQAVAVGGTYLDPSVTHEVITDALSHHPHGGDEAQIKLTSLTEQERRVLTLLAQGMTTSDIAATLTVTAATVKSHISHLLRKLRLRDRVQAVVFAYSSGLASPVQSPPFNEADELTVRSSR